MNEVVDLAQHRRVQLPESVVEIFCNIQLRSGATWSTTLAYKDAFERFIGENAEWIEFPCLVRRPTGKGEIANVQLRKAEIIAMIDSHDYIDTAVGRPVDAG